VAERISKEEEPTKKSKDIRRRYKNEANESVHHALLPAARRKRAGLVAVGSLCINIPLG
jgi:hypothetical protein